MNAGVTTFVVKGLHCINTDRTRSVSALESNHKVMVFVSNCQDNIVLPEFAGYLIPDTFRAFNFDGLTGSARSLNCTYQSLKVSAGFRHCSPF